MAVTTCNGFTECFYIIGIGPDLKYCVKGQLCICLEDVIGYKVNALKGQ